MSLSLSLKNVIHNDSAYALLMHTLMDEPRLLPKTFFKRDFFSETATKEKISLRERLFNSELKKPLLECIEKINHMLSEKSLIVAFADRKVHVKQAVLEQIPYLNEVFKEILAYEKPFDFTEHKVSDFPLQTFETLLKYLPFLENGKLPKALINENLLSLFMLAAHLGLDVSMHRLRNGVVDHFKKLSFEKLCTLYRETPFNQAQILILFSIAEKFFDFSCLESGIAFLNAKEEIEAYAIWKSASFSKKVTSIPCYTLVKNFLKNLGDERYQPALNVLEELCSDKHSNDPYKLLFEEKFKLAQALTCLGAEFRIPLKDKLRTLEFSFFHDLTSLIQVCNNIETNERIDPSGVHPSWQIMRIGYELSSCGYVIKAQEFANRQILDFKINILCSVAWAFNTQPVPHFEMMEEVIEKILDVNGKAEALNDLAAVYLKQNPPLFEKAEKTVNKISRDENFSSNKKDQGYRQIVTQYLKVIPPKIIEARHIVEKIAREGERIKGNQEIAKACLEHVPPLFSLAKEIVRRKITRNSQKTETLWLISLTHLKQDPPEINEATEVAKEIPDSSKQEKLLEQIKKASIDTSHIKAIPEKINDCCLL